MYLLYIAPLINILCGLAVILGWFSGNTTLIQILPTFAPMQFNTALGFVLIGLSLILCIKEKTNLYIPICIAVLIFNSLTLIQYLSDYNFKIDELFFKHYITTNTSHPGRMGPNSSICFIIASLTLIIFNILQKFNPNKLIYARLISILGLAAAFISFAGYIVKVPTSYGWGAYTQMAVHTSLGFIIWFLGFLYYFKFKTKKFISSASTTTSSIILLTSMCVFLYLSQALIKKEQEYILSTQLNASQDITHNVKEKFRLTNEALIRMAYRLKAHSYTNMSSWEIDAENYIKHFRSVKVIQLLNSDLSATSTKSKNDLPKIPLIGELSDYKLLSKNSNALISKPINTQGEIGFWLLYPYTNLNKRFYFASYISMQQTAALSIATENNKNYDINIFHDGMIVYSNKAQPALPNSSVRTINLSNLQRSVAFNIYDIPFVISTQPKQILFNNFMSFVPEAVLILGVFLTMLIYMLVNLLVAHTKTTKTLSLLLESTKSISNSDNFEQAIENCIKGILSIINWEAGKVHYLNNITINQDKVFFKDNRYNNSFKKSLARFDTAHSTDMLQECINSKKPVHFKCKKTTFLRLRFNNSNPVTSSIFIPVLKYNTVIIVLQFYKINSLANDVDFLNILEVLSQHISAEYSKKEAEQIIRNKSTELSELNQKLEILSNTDPLTGFYNRRAFEQQANKIFSYAKRHKSMIAILYLDLDHFKHLNDTHGHLIGDKILQITANRINDTIRKEDLLARFGGDEFVVVLSHINITESIESIVCKIREAIEQPAKIDNVTINIKVSIGYKVCGINDTLQQSLQEADKVLYQDKNKRKIQSRV